MLASICYVESHYDVNAIHHDDGNGDSLGVCQIKLSTAQWLGFKGSQHRLMSPKVNTYYAAKYLRYEIDRYNSDFVRAIISYNMGSAKDFTHTKYSDKVMKQWETNSDETN
jgi:soluble lytic murein transglycosylase-like protein